MESRPMIVTILLLASLMALGMVSIDIYLPAMPSITKDLHSTHSVIQLTIGLYLLFLAIGQLIYGPLSDHYARRPMLYIGLFIYIVASLACTVTSSDTVLIVCRVFQALGVSCPMVISSAATRGFEDDLVRAKAMSYIGMSISLSPIVGPIIGAMLEQHFGWRSNFAAMVFLGVVVTILTFFLYPRQPSYKELDSGKELHLFKPYLEVIKNIYFWRYAICVVLSFSSLLSFIVNSSYLLISLTHLNVRQFAIVYAINGSLIVVGNYVGVFMRKHIHIDLSLMIGALCIVIGGVLLTIFALMPHHISALRIIIPVYISTLGTIFTLSPSNAMALKSFPTLAGSASAMANFLRLSFASIIASLVGLFLSKSLVVLSGTMLFCGVGILLALLILPGYQNGEFTESAY